MEMRNKSWGVDLYLSSDAVIEGVYFCQNNYDINADPGCSADAWSCNFSSSEEGGSVLGNVAWDAWNWCGFQKQAVTPTSTALGKNNAALNSADSSLSEYREAMSIYHTIKRNLKQDQKSGESVNPQKYAPEFASAIEKFKQVVTNYPGSADAISSLGRIATSYRVLNDFEPLEDYMQKIANDTELYHLRPYALSALIPSHIKQKNYLKAIDLSDQIIQEFPNDPIVCQLLYGKGLIYKYFLNDLEKAKEMFNSVVSKCPDHKTAQSARDELEHTGLAKDSAEEQTPVELSVQNYPNPFNPETRFQLALPEPGKVVLKIFDILGREVKTLIDADKLAGRYTIVWDGKNREGREVASGTYLYQLQFNGQTLTKKILLMR